MSILIVSAVHDYRMKRRGSLQALAEALRDQGAAVTFLSVRFSWLSRLTRDPRQMQAIASNVLVRQDGIDCFLWKTPVHPFGASKAWVNRLLTPFFWVYAVWPNPRVDDLIRRAETIVIESGLSVVLAGRARRLNPDAKLIYRASDRLSTIRQHPEIARRLRASRPLFTHFALLGAGMADDFAWAFPRAFLVPPTVDRRLLDQDAASPFGPGRHAVSPGPMLFDAGFFDVAGPLFPAVTFHIFGVPEPAGRTCPNVLYRPEIPYADTLPFLQHADVGIAPYRADDNIAYLAETSSKLMQYDALGLPAVCPAAVVGRHSRRFGYQPDDPASIAAAMAAALATPRGEKSARPSWTEMAQRLLAPENYTDTRLKPCGSGPPIRLTLIVATLGRRDPLRRLFTSLAAQSSEAFDVILVDQNPSGYLDDILADVTGPFRLTLITSEPGLSRARNKGLSLATGDLVAFPDDDCWYPERLVDDVARFFALYSGTDILMGQTVDQHGNISLNPARGLGGAVTARNVWTSGNSNTLFVRKTVAQALRFSEQLGVGAPTPYQSGEETDFVLRGLARGARAMSCPDLLVYHEQVDSTVGRKQLMRAWRYSAGFGRVLRTHYHPIYAAYRVTRSLAGAALHLTAGRPLRALNGVAWGVGTIRGWLF